jgi:hypothetical protein
MGFKKIKYNNGEGLVKIKIEDETGAKQESWTIMLSDLGQWSAMMCRKYGIEKRKKDEDLDWAL